MPALRNSVQLEHRLKQEGLGVMLAGEGGTAGEGGGASPSSCGILQLVGVLGWDRCVGQLRQRGWDGRSGGTRDRFGRASRGATSNCDPALVKRRYHSINLC